LDLGHRLGNFDVFELFHGQVHVVPFLPQEEDEGLAIPREGGREGGREGEVNM
jgi:hypothetical protein